MHSGAECVSADARGCTAAIVVLMLSPASIQNLHGQTATCDLKGHLDCLKWVQLARPSLAGSSFVVTSKDLYQQSLQSFDQLCQIQKSCLRRLRRSLGSASIQLASQARFLPYLAWCLVNKKDRTLRSALANPAFVPSTSFTYRSAQHNVHQYPTWETTAPSC